MRNMGSRVKAILKIVTAVLISAVVSALISGLYGYTAGRWHGIDIGVQYASKQIETDLNRSVPKNTWFKIAGIEKIEFFQSQDGQINYKATKQGKREKIDVDKEKE